ncbi:MAG: Hsp20/alpha crystallin family protein [Rhodobacteraceae bacterium]|jgi:HSP20 family protein|uniref:Hsp20/alpha crystallin family protein n=1 Tax=Albidovulum sp. TaxID=1872424 RepID=UPI001D3029AB|nr:Hsp20/alpha crystallin family protein [uncultured Defluviimonas sp.]MCB2126902.1 Hsp20/alpha crystallin family protein [Paracoccaceae bacterium]MCC0068936.1 Hsp20/alpha crystallin family protein [Paracoccaceae bacterium]
MVEKTPASAFWPSFYEPFRHFGARLSEWLAPASEASSDDKTYRIAIELPGVEEKDIEVTVNEGMVTVKGEKKESREEKGDTWYFSERQFGSFSRSFRLPADADQGKVSADLRDGVLTLTVARAAPEVATSRKVPIGKS